MGVLPVHGESVEPWTGLHPKVPNIRRFEHQMKRDLMDILACPVCKGTLQLAVTKEDDREIIEGTLTCEACSETYPIEDTIPNMLPPGLRD